jgi:hypothetical protein
VFSVCFRAFLGLHGLDPGQGFLGGLLGQKDGVGLGQLDAHDLNCGPPRPVIPTRSDLDARKEGLVVAASRALVGQFIDARDVLRQLQGAAEIALVDFEATFRLGERGFGGGDLLLHPAALGAERVG